MITALIRYIGKKTILGILVFLLVFSIVYNQWVTSDIVNSNRRVTTELNSALGPFSTEHVTGSNRIMDLDDFHFVENNENVCSGISSEENLLLIVVHSALKNAESRQIIRETWGSVSKYKNWNVRLIFLLGLPKPSFLRYIISFGKEKVSLPPTLQTEIQLHRDIIVGSFTDTYRNMTYKHLMGYKWILDYCNFATAIARVDDDMFIDVFQVSEFLVQNQNRTSSSLFCLLMKERKPEREYMDKWAVTRKEYEADVYPDYCLGAAYLTTPKLVSKLFDVSSRFRYFWIDDVLVTGVLRTYMANLGEPIGIVDISSRFNIVNASSKWKNEWMFVLVKREWMPYGFKKIWRVITHKKKFTSVRI